MDRVIVFDTALRDGEQAPGFPISSDEDFEATREAARQVGTLDNAPTICGPPRVGLADIDRCWEAVKRSGRSR